jgi:hypothetical protein
MAVRQIAGNGVSGKIQQNMENYESFHQNKPQNKEKSKERVDYPRTGLLDWPENVPAQNQNSDGEELQHGDHGSASGSPNRNDYANMPSRLLSYEQKQKKKALDPLYEKDRINRRKDRIKKFGEQSRWLANTSFQTYYGKPAFENYGRGNTQPTFGICNPI